MAAKKPAKKSKGLKKPKKIEKTQTLAIRYKQ
jgi:hypothetical protein